MEYDTHSIAELREIVASIGGFHGNLLATPRHELVGFIRNSQKPPPPPVPVMPIPTNDDERYRTRPPAKYTDEKELRRALEPYLEKGMTLEVHGQSFLLRYAGREDSGTMRQPPRAILKAAHRLATHGKPIY